MWRNWFPNGIFPTKRVKNANLQERILSLSESSKQVTIKDGSPMLKELQNQKFKVSRMSSVYEENIAAFNENNCSVVARKSNSLNAVIVPRVEQRNAIAVQELLQPTKGSEKIKNFVEYALENEREYIERMELMIETYVNACDKIPALSFEIIRIRSQKEEIFGPVDKIYMLHRNEILPRLASCVEDFTLFGKTISAFCNEGIFNVYIVFAMDEKDCDYRRQVYNKYFMAEIERQSGISFDFSPIQHLARLHLIIIDMLRELRNIKAPASVIDSLVKAEADWRILMNKIFAMRNL